MIKGDIWRRVFGEGYSPPAGVSIDQEPSPGLRGFVPPQGSVTNFMAQPLFNPDGTPMPSYQEAGGVRYHIPNRLPQSQAQPQRSPSINAPAPVMEESLPDFARPPRRNTALL